MDNFRTKILSTHEEWKSSISTINYHSGFEAEEGDVHENQNTNSSYFSSIFGIGKKQTPSPPPPVVKKQQTLDITPEFKGVYMFGTPGLKKKIIFIKSNKQKIKLIALIHLSLERNIKLNFKCVFFSLSHYLCCLLFVV